MTTSLPVGFFDLPKNLRLPNHHGIKTGRYAKQMAHCLISTMQVEGLLKNAPRGLLKVGKEILNRLNRSGRILCGQEKFYTVARREKNDFIHDRLSAHYFQHLRVVFTREGQAFPNLYRRCFVIQADYNDFPIFHQLPQKT
jgi:hypothetical protein